MPQVSPRTRHLSFHKSRHCLLSRERTQLYGYNEKHFLPPCFDNSNYSGLFQYCLLLMDFFYLDGLVVWCLAGWKLRKIFAPHTTRSCCNNSRILILRGIFIKELLIMYFFFPLFIVQINRIKI